MPDDIRAKFLSIPQLVAVVDAARRDSGTLVSGLTSLCAETPAIGELIGMHKEEFATLLNSTEPLPKVATATEADKMDTSDDGALATLANLSSTADPLPPEKEAAMATSDDPETETARTVPTPPDRAPDCPVCLGELGGDAAAEAVTLRCGHTVHLACWMPVVLMVGAGETAQRRHIEDRMGRKCVLCRTDFSSEVTKALRSRRAILRKVEGEEARDEQYEAMLRSMAPGHRLLPENAAAEAAPLQQQMPLPPEACMLLLSQENVVVDQAKPVLCRLMRAELQAAGQSPSGAHNTLVARLISNRLASTSFFLKLHKERLFDALQDTPPAREVRQLVEQLEAQLADAEEQQRRRQLRDATRDAAVVAAVRRSQLPIAGGLGGMLGGPVPGGGAFAPPPPRPPPLSEEEEAQVGALVAMGFERPRAVQAFVECGRNQEHAANYLLSGAI